MINPDDIHRLKNLMAIFYASLCKLYFFAVGFCTGFCTGLAAGVTGFGAGFAPVSLAVMI